jgi:hypothetical protein
MHPELYSIEETQDEDEIEPLTPSMAPLPEGYEDADFARALQSELIGWSPDLKRVVTCAAASWVNLSRSMRSPNGVFSLNLM